MSIFQTALEWWNEVPQTAISLISGALGGTVSTFVAPWMQWGIERKRELRQYRRQLVANWHAMVGDVSKELGEMEKTGNWGTGDALRLLERHAAYASFTAAGRPSFRA